MVWTVITIPWVKSDLRREKKAWAENRGQGGIPWVDDIDAPTRTRFASVQERLPNFLPWTREKQSAPSTPSVDGAEDGAKDTGHIVDGAPEVPANGHRPEHILLGDQSTGGTTNGATHDEKPELPDTDTTRETTFSNTAAATGDQPSSH